MYKILQTKSKILNKIKNKKTIKSNWLLFTEHIVLHGLTKDPWNIFLALFNHFYEKVYDYDEIKCLLLFGWTSCFAIQKSQLMYTWGLPNTC